MLPTPTPYRPSLARAFPIMLLVLGVSLVGIYGQRWLALPEYAESDIEASTELNLQIDLQRRGPHLQPDAEGRDRLRAAVRAEVEADIRAEREEVQTRFAVGLIALVLALGHVVFLRAGARP